MIYVVIFNAEPEQPLQKSLEISWPESGFQLSPTIAFVKEPQLLLQDIAENVGLNESNPGVILPANGPYAGWNHKELWDWLIEAKSNA